MEKMVFKANLGGPHVVANALFQASRGLDHFLLNSKDGPKVSVLGLSDEERTEWLDDLADLLFCGDVDKTIAAWSAAMAEQEREDGDSDA